MEALKWLLGLVAVALAVLVILGGLKRDREGNVLAPAPASIVLAVLLVIAGFTLDEAFGQVSAGFRGVVLRFGAPTGEVKEPGLYMIPPWIESVVPMNVQIQAYHAEAIEAASSDLQDVHTSVTVNYQIDPGRVVEVYTNLRNDAEARILSPNVQETIKSTTAKFTAQQLIQERPIVKETADKTLASRVEPFGLRIDATSITQFQFSPSFTQAIEAKVAAEQNALTAQRNLERVKFEAAQQVELARAQAQALSLQKTAVTPELVALRRIEAQLKAVDKWDGHMPNVVTSGGPVPLLDVFGK